MPHNGPDLKCERCGATATYADASVEDARRRREGKREHQWRELNRGGSYEEMLGIPPLERGV